MHAQLQKVLVGVEALVAHAPYMHARLSKLLLGTTSACLNGCIRPDAKAINSVQCDVGWHAEEVKQ